VLALPIPVVNAAQVFCAPIAVENVPVTEFACPIAVLIDSPVAKVSVLLLPKITPSVAVPESVAVLDSPKIAVLLPAVPLVNVLLNPKAIFPVESPEGTLSTPAKSFLYPITLLPNKFRHFVK